MTKRKNLLLAHLQRFFPPMIEEFHLTHKVCGPIVKINKCRNIEMLSLSHGKHFQLLNFLLENKIRFYNDCVYWIFFFLSKALYIFKKSIKWL